MDTILSTLFSSARTVISSTANAVNEAVFATVVNSSEEPLQKGE